jgi:hypothetical protein
MSAARSSEQPGVARSVGQAVGILWNAIVTPVAPRAVQVSRRTETLEQGGVTLRRTTIDEVVVPAPQATTSPSNP